MPETHTQRQNERVSEKETEKTLKKETELKDILIHAENTQLRCSLEASFAFVFPFTFWWKETS